MQENKTTMAEVVARNITKQSAAVDIQICTWSKLCFFEKGTKFIAVGDAICAVDEFGNNDELFTVGDFKVYLV